MWDYRVLEILERWQAQFSTAVGEWFNALGRCEALVGGATLADEYPEWGLRSSSHERSLPVRCRATRSILCMTDQARVPNDVSIQSTQPLVLVTGFKHGRQEHIHAGRRLNLLLLRTGSPVCATRLENTPIQLGYQHPRSR